MMKKEVNQAIPIGKLVLWKDNELREVHFDLKDKAITPWSCYFSSYFKPAKPDVDARIVALYHKPKPAKDAKSISQKGGKK